MTHCGRSGMSDYIRMVHIKNEHSCHGHYSHGCSNIWSHCCGGGTSFMGGVGAGLAYGLVNWAMSGLTNWFGGMGFGGGNWFGGMGWGNVGFGGGNYGFWGMNGTQGAGNSNGSSSTYDEYLNRRYGSSTRVGSSDGADGADGKINDIDNAKIADITEKIVKLKTGAVSEGDYNTIKQQIDEAKGTTDEINKDSDLKSYDNLQKLLDDKKNGTVTPEGATVKIGDKTYFVSQLNPDLVKLLTKEAIDEAVSGNNAKDIAKAILKEAGALAGTGELKATTNFALLYLAQKAEVDIKCGHNSSLDNVEGALPYIHGKVSNVDFKKEGSDDIITFTVTDENGTYDMQCVHNGKQYTLNAMTSDKYTQNIQDVVYTISEYAERTGDPAAKKKPELGV